jgi:hypothetical protein
MKRHHQVPTRLIVVAVLLGLQGCANLSTGSLLSGSTDTKAQAADQAIVGQQAPGTLSRGGSADAERHYEVAKYWMGQNRLTEALQSLDRALSLHGNHVEALNARASVQADLGRLQEARVDLDRALSLAPDRIHLHYNSGLLHRKTGQHASAREAIARVLRIDPGHARAAELMSSLPVPSSQIVTLEALQASSPSNAQTSLSVMRITPSDPVSNLDTVIRVPQSASELPPPVESVVQERPSVQVTRITLAPPDVSTAPSRGVASPTELRREPIQSVSIMDLESTQPIQREGAIRPAQAEEASPSQTVRIIGATVTPPGQPSISTPAVIAIRSMPGDAARIDIANGNGINGMARALRGQLRAVGVQVATISNWTHFHQPVTRVLYREGFEQAARELAQRMPVQVELVAAERLPRADRDVMVVLGRDMRGYRATASGWENMAQMADIPAA